MYSIELKFEHNFIYFFIVFQISERFCALCVVKGMEITMKIRNIIIFTLCILIATSVFTSTFTSAATLKINIINLLPNDELSTSACHLSIKSCRC